MADYFQARLNVNQWDQVRTKTVFSTIENAGVEIDDGTITLIAPPSKVIAAAPVAKVVARVAGVAKVGAGVVVDFGETSWMIDFGSVARREQDAAYRKQGAVGMLKIFAGAYNPKRGVNTVREGKARRDDFVATLARMGATVE